MVLLWFIPRITRELGFLKKTQLLADEYRFYDEEDVACIFKWEASIHTRPTVPFTIICLASFTAFFSILPTIYMFISGNIIGGIIFMHCTSFTSQRHTLIRVHLLLYWAHTRRAGTTPSQVTMGSLEQRVQRDGNTNLDCFMPIA